MLKNSYRLLIIVFLLWGVLSRLEARTGRYRCMWRDDPATTMVVGWDQFSGSYPVIYYDEADFGRNASAYRNSRMPDHVVYAKGMNNCFARLTGLKPNTVYYFLIKDSEGISQRLSFRTAPATPDTRLSIIAGGDSRNNREARRSANLLVSKLRPTFIIFDGDMTVNDEAREWQDWFDDWQSTIGSDGRVFPVIVARGNHEMSNESMIDLFDVPHPEVYYALTIGGNLLRVYTLNSLIAPGGDQRDWLEQDLSTHQQVTWRFAQYHHSIRPHTARKPEKDELLINWATLFYEYRVQLVLESDAHVVKTTWPIRPSVDPGNDEGFVRDDEKGTVYIGEGCWGAPLRENNDNKSWTRSSGSFNQFKWVFIDPTRIEIRTVRTDDATQVAEIDHRNIFEPPLGLVLWNPEHGDVVTIHHPKYRPAPAPVADIGIDDFSAAAGAGGISVEWKVSRDRPGLIYELHRSTDGGRTFAPIGSLRSGTARGGAYQFSDEAPSTTRDGGRVQYRLRCIPPLGAATEYDTELTLLPPGRPAVSSSNPDDWSALPRALPDPATGRVKVKFELSQVADVDLILIDRQYREKSRLPLRRQPPGTNVQPFDLNAISRGQYLLIIKSGSQVLERYYIVKDF